MSKIYPRPPEKNLKKSVISDRNKKMTMLKVGVVA